MTRRGVPSARVTPPDVEPVEAAVPVETTGPAGSDGTAPAAAVPAEARHTTTTADTIADVRRIAELLG
jgi:hypothetical protein